MATERVNISMPEELADAVREADLPVSRICQHALRGALRKWDKMAQEIRNEAEPRYPESVTYHPDEGHREELPEDSPVVLAHVIAEAIRDIAAGSGHECKWMILAVKKSEPPRVIHPLLNQTPITRVLMKCEECGDVRVVELPGEWTAEQVMGMELTPLS